MFRSPFLIHSIFISLLQLVLQFLLLSLLPRLPFLAAIRLNVGYPFRFLQLLVPPGYLQEFYPLLPLSEVLLFIRVESLESYLLSFSFSIVLIMHNNFPYFISILIFAIIMIVLKYNIYLKFNGYLK